jgi:esterase/lipase superfamily enzyme
MVSETIGLRFLGKGSGSMIGRALVASIAVVAAGVSAPARAQTCFGGWVALAVKEIDLKGTGESIDVSRARGAFRALRLENYGEAIRLLGIRVVYGDKSVHAEDRPIELRRGDRTRPIQPRNTDQFVDTVILMHATEPTARGKARIAVCGQQTAAGAALRRPSSVVVAAPKPGQPAAGGQATSGSTPGAPQPRIEPSAKSAKAAKEAVEAKPPTPAPAPKSSPGQTQGQGPRPSEPPPSPAPAPPRPTVATVPSPPPTESAKRPTDAAKTGRPRGAAEEAEKAKADSHVVPVFFGTDRTASQQSQRVVFGTERAKSLTLGRALVTVPKSHQIPNIERPAVYYLPFTRIVLYREREDETKHFTMKQVTRLTKEEFLALVRERLAGSSSFKDHAFVFVHGFNTQFDYAVFRTAQIAYDLRFDGAPFLYSWPSKAEVGGAPYAYDRESVTQAEPQFRRFLDMVTGETGAKTVSIIAHSMGNQLVLNTLRDVRRSAPRGVEISQVILAAPDVDRDSFEFLAREIQGVSRGVTLYAAANDRALDISRRFWGGVPRAGDVPAGGPLVVPGVDTIDVTAINTELLSLHHSGYAEKTALVADIQRLIQTGERPPELRFPILQRVKTDKGDYWRVPGPR